VAAVMLAKTERAGDLAPLAGVAVIPLIESAAGFDQLRAIAAEPLVQRLAFGAIDFQLDLGMHAHYEELLFFRSQLVLASRLAGLAPPIDSPSTTIEDTGPVQAEAQAARRLGFGGKLCIHPRQLAVVNAAFSPTAEETAWAQGVLAAAAQSQGAAVALNGQMIDKPVILRAQAILAQRG
jgi:citrate lyase subunit beta/citryl-CoA lyase